MNPYQNEVEMKISKNQIIILSFTIILSGICQAAIYKSIDSKGNSIFSDQASATATEVQFISAAFSNSYEKETKPNSANEVSPSPENTVNEEQKSPVNLSHIRIISPTQEQAFWNQRQIPVSLAITAQLPDTYKTQLLLDGIPYEEPQSKKTFILDNLKRGKHHLQANLLDLNGQLIESSDIITLYIHYGISQKTLL